MKWKILLSYQINEIFAPQVFSKPVFFSEISSVKNADFCLGVHLVQITTVIRYIIQILQVYS